MPTTTRSANTKSKRGKKAKSGKEEKEEKEEPRTIPYDRLHPSKIRLPCDHKFKPFGYDELSEKQKKDKQLTHGDLLNEYQLCPYDPDTDSFDAEAIRLMFAPPVTKHLSLPNIAIGSAKDLKTQMEASIPRKASGLVRGIHISPEFRNSFYEEKFSPSYSIIVVPYLTPDEEDEYEKDPIKFDKKMCHKNREWLKDPKRKFWVCDGATRFTLCTEFNYSIQCMFVHPRIPYHHACMLAIGSNEGTGHISNDTLFLDKVKSIGAWSEQDFSQKQIAEIAKNWGARSRISRIYQCYDAIYGGVMATSAPKIVEKDLHRPEKDRLWHEGFFLSKVFKSLQKDAESGWTDLLMDIAAYDDNFIKRCVEIGCVKNPTSFGATTMQRYSWVFFMRLELIKAVETKIAETDETAENKEAMRIAKEQLAKLEKGEYDAFIRSKLNSLEGTKDFGKNPDGPNWTTQHVLDRSDELIHKPWFRANWKAVHSKLKKQRAGFDMGTEKIAKCIMTQADATKEDSMESALKHCYRLLPDTKKMKHVILTSPPWGVLRSGQIPDHGDEEAENVDKALTAHDIGTFAGIIHKLYPENVIVVLHLPIGLVEQYKNQFQNNGFVMMRMPLTVVHTGGMRSKNFRASNFIRNSNHFFIFVKSDTKKPDATYHDAKRRFPKATSLKQLYVSGITLKDNMVP